MSNLDLLTLVSIDTEIEDSNLCGKCRFTTDFGGCILYEESLKRAFNSYIRCDLCLLHRINTEDGIPLLPFNAFPTYED